MSTYPNIYQRIASALRPMALNSPAAILRDKDLVGGYRVVDTIEERNNIPQWLQVVEDLMPGSNFRRKGMLVYVVQEEKTYRLGNGLTNDDWQEVSVGDIEEMYYTNLLPVPQDIGGVLHGESFNQVPLQAMWDKLLYPELQVKFDNFRINGTSILTLHEGQTSSSSYTFSWLVNNGHLLDVGHDITIKDDQANNVIYTGPSIASGSQVITGLPQITGVEGENYYFTIYAMDIYGNPLNRKCRIRWIEPLPPDTYPVTLGTTPSGISAQFSGQGNYEAGDEVTINIYNIHPKYSFLNWFVVAGEVDLATPEQPNCTFHIGILPVTINALLKEPHKVFLSTSVIGGGAVTSSFNIPNGSIFAHEETVNIELVSLSSGYTFSHWEVIAGGATLDNTSNNPTFFEMPDNDVTIIAHVTPPPTINMYYGAAASKDENMNLTTLQSTGTTQQNITHPNQVISSFFESFNSEYIVMAVPEDWFSGGSIQVAYQLGGLTFGLGFEGTQVHQGIVYRVYFSGLRQNRTNTNVYIG